MCMDNYMFMVRDKIRKAKTQIEIELAMDKKGRTKHSIGILDVRGKPRKM